MLLGVCIGWINHSPTDDDSNEKREPERDFVIVRPPANFHDPRGVTPDLRKPSI
jgi:hypothetical protein